MQLRQRLRGWRLHTGVPSCKPEPCELRLRVPGADSRDLHRLQRTALLCGLCRQHLARAGQTRCDYGRRELGRHTLWPHAGEEPARERVAGSARHGIAARSGRRAVPFERSKLDFHTEELRLDLPRKARHQRVHLLERHGQIRRVQVDGFGTRECLRYRALRRRAEPCTRRAACCTP